ncbi:MAG: hypothetical protein NC328_08555 [Muribaculum sp.]|nr:hypothetical protein [Muribaculum sp.]
MKKANITTDVRLFHIPHQRKIRAQVQFAKKSAPPDCNTVAQGKWPS